jgi:endonuclease/exonuclease/phosphatase family metal-dependent hydrolase
MNRIDAGKALVFRLADPQGTTALVLVCWVVALLFSGGFGGRLHAEERGSPGISVVSLNVATTDTPADLANEIRSKGLGEADVYLLQEVLGEELGRSSIARELLPGRTMHVFYQGAFELDPGRMYGLAIVSRFPLRDQNVIYLRRNDLNVRSRVRIAIAATIDGPSGPITLINTHLDTRINLRRRLEQLEPVVDYAVSTQFPTILGGDLNTNDHRWLFHLVPIPYAQPQREAIRRYMDGWGFESVIDGRKGTHDVLNMQLDWIFVRGMHAGEVRVQPLKNSDHHAVFADVRVGAEPEMRHQTASNQ